MQQNLTSTEAPRNESVALQKIDLTATKSFSTLFLDYLKGNPKIDPFYGRKPILENFPEQIQEKSGTFTPEKRKVLTEVLKRQYQGLPLGPVAEQLERLNSENTYTITTGHQLNLFTGPLYFIYKIITAITTCQVLKRRYPDQHFVPVYWMASEDHDFEEINYFRLFGKTYAWETTQQGAVGRFNTGGIEQILEQLPEGAPFFEKAYKGQSTLAGAVREYVHHLFGDQGLVVLDADDRTLKSLFRSVMQDDLQSHSAHKAVSDTSVALGDSGYKTQVYPREINLFYLDRSLRGRIEKKEGKYSVAGSDLSFSEAELLKIIEEEPEKLSPNVVLRPLYQEMILPNLAYIGGPGELAYWLQLKGMFEHFQVPFPLLMPRNFALILGKSLNKKFQKTEMDITDLFLEKEMLLKKYVQENTENELQFSDEKTQLKQLFDSITSKGGQIDTTLTKMIEAQHQKAVKSIEDIEKRLLKAEKRNHETKLKQIEALKESLFPHGGLQERSDNFLNFYLNDPGFIQLLLEHFDPFDHRFNILMENP